MGKGWSGCFQQSFGDTLLKPSEGIVEVNQIRAAAVLPHVVRHVFLMK